MEWSKMKEKGWRSKDTLYKARNQLIQAGMIVLTRQGGKNIPSLYAVTWLGIDECNGKLDCASRSSPLGYWKLGCVPYSGDSAPYSDHTTPPNGPIDESILLN